MNNLVIQIKHHTLKISFLLASILLALVLAVSYASAQSTEDPWTTHLNLSNSGSTLDPVVVSDSDGRIHVLWQDAFAGFVYTSFENDQWSQPVSVEFPFSINQRTLYKPTLAASDDGYVYAFWLDDRGVLSFTRVLNKDFGVKTAWETARSLGNGFSNFAVTIDKANVLHLIYLRTEETVDFSAGIYYLQSKDGGRNWSATVGLYQSPYLRGKSDIDSSLSVATANSGDVERVYLTWDNRPLKRIFLDISNDGGITWEPSVEIDAPDLETSSASSFDLLVGAEGDTVHLIWQKGDPESSCNHFYQWSKDGGVTWSERLPMPAQLVGCADSQQFIIYREDFALLQKTIDKQVYFIAWDGAQWSEPQLQDALISFVDPQTLEVIDFGCQNYDFLPDKNLISVVGCDTDGVGDIWFTSRPIGSINDLFPPPPIWTAPSTTASSPGEIHTPILLTDSKGLIHLIWIQEDEITLDGAIKNIYYSQWNGEDWTVPLAPFEDSDDNAVSLSAAIGMNDILYLTWNDSNTMENFFSWANTEQALRTTEWADVQSLPFPQLIGSSPDVFVDQFNTIYVTTVIPINERRGVYLIRSSDLGQTWSDPIQVFDAVSADWPVVAQPRITGTFDGRKHMVWTQYSIPGGPGPTALYYASSDDNGDSWSEPTLVVEAPVTWSRILGFGDQVVHIVWQEFRSGRPVIRHQFSQDGGITWSPIATISNFENAVGEPSVTLDPSGQLHLIQILNETGDKLVLKHWSWDGDRWITNDGADLGDSSSTNVQESAAVATKLGELKVVYSGKITQESSSGLPYELFNTSRKITLPATLPTFSPALTPLPTSTPKPEVVATPTLIPSPTPFVAPTLEASGSQSSPSINLAALGLAFGGALAILIVVLVVILRLRGRVF